MHSPALRLHSLLRWIVLATIVLVATVLWLNAVEGGVAKLPILFVGAMLVAALFAADTIVEGKIRFSWSTLDILILLHLPLFLISAALHCDPVYTFRALTLSLSCLVFFFAASRLYTTEKSLGLLLDGLEWLTFVLCVVAAFQLVFGDALPLSFGLGPDRRVMSLLDNSAYFASYLVLMFPVILSRALRWTWKSGRAAIRIALAAFVLLMLAATQTRSSVLACGFSTATFFLLGPLPRKTKMAALILTAIVFGGLLYPYAGAIKSGSGFQSIAEGGRSSTLARRLYFWHAGIEAFRAAPLFGHGIGGFERSVMEFRKPDYWKVGSEDVVPHAHNEIIEVAVEYGCVGLLLLLGSFALVIRKGIHIGRHTTGLTRWTAAGITSALIGVAVDNLLNVSLRQPPIALLAWLMMGLLFSPALSSGNGRIITIPLRSPRYVAAVPVLLWIAASAWYLTLQVGVLDASVRIHQASMETGSNPGSAATDLSVAIVEDPYNLLARSQLTLAMLNTERWTDALGAIEELQQLSPRYPKSHLMKAYAMFRLGRHREALENILEELRQRSHPEAFQMQAVICRSLHEEKGERRAIVNLLRNDIEGRLAVAYRPSCERLMELNRTAQDRAESASLLDSLELSLNQDSSFFRQLKSRFDTPP